MKLHALAGLFLLGACSTLNTSGDTPAAAPPSAQAAYLAPDAVDLNLLLPPPPAAGSKDERVELDAMLALQKQRTPAQANHAAADARVDLTQFSGVLGPAFKPETMPAVTRFFQNVGRSTGPYVGVAKDCWARLRPFVTEPRLQPAGDIKASAGARKDFPRADIHWTPDSPCAKDAVPSDYTYSYPSGHASWGAMTAILLAEMVPEKRAALFARGWQYGDSRIIGGVHYPSDVTAGRIQATVLVALMSENPQFVSDLAAARTELRFALSLAP